jgi:hypothetical protein
VPVNTLGNAHHGWEFSVPANARWGATQGTPAPSQRKDIEDELAATDRPQCPRRPKGRYIGPTAAGFRQPPEIPT